ncbi:colicin immunity protein [Burkholderia diffusa]|uniref:colicin immunity protein n=1 Tax=Burkholderia diffusa TaxID=488732 RepID=UPI00157B1BF6|nr:colicin immunity protein [Burkholderia diffusa]NTY38018.1 colicin immunity protein [Burkholderia diffusa]
MNIDRQRRYETADDFFSLGGSIVMKLTVGAAIDVCEQAAQHGVVVSRIEGGIWHSSGFEARIDCIWDAKIDPPVDESVAEQNNRDAVEFIREESQVHDVFIVTTFKKDRPIRS